MCQIVCVNEYLLLVILNPEFVTVLRTMSGVIVVNLHLRSLANAGGYFSTVSLYWQKFIAGGILEKRLGLNGGRGDVEGVPLYKREPEI